MTASESGNASEASAGRILEGKVAIITGAGRGIGRGYAMEMARLGARVVVNDLGTSRQGSGTDRSVAQTVVDAIEASGGKAIADNEDISTWPGAERLIGHATEAFGGLDILVNNASVTRDGYVVDMG